MNDRPGAAEPRIQRILVAIDASPFSLAALRAAVALARRFQARVEGVYVEDTWLLGALGSGFTTEIGLHTAAARRVDRTEVEREVRAQAAAARRAYHRAVTRARLAPTFHVVRGCVPVELARRAAESDLVVLGKRSGPVVLRGHVGSTARALLGDVTRVTLVTEGDLAVRPPAVVLFDGGDTAETALRVALRIADPGAGFVVLLAGSDPGENRALRDRARTILEPSVSEARFHPLADTSPAGIAAVIRRERRGIVVLPAESDLLPREARLALVEQLEMPVLVVR